MKIRFTTIVIATIFTGKSRGQDIIHDQAAMSSASDVDDAPVFAHLGGPAALPPLSLLKNKDAKATLTTGKCPASSSWQLLPNLENPKMLQEPRLTLQQVS